MSLKKYKLGDLIKQRREKYDGSSLLDSWGVSRDGFIKPKQDGADTSIYNVFYKNDFVFNPARMELNSIALNTKFDKAICSSLYEIFYVINTNVVLPEYLNIYIKRSQFARRCWFMAIGSARNYFRVPDLSEFEIELPSIEIQRKYVDIYNALVENQKSYERGLDDLKLTCDAYIENLKSNTKIESIGKYIEQVKNKNINYDIKEVYGVSNTLQFITASSSVDKDNLLNYKIVEKHDIAYVPTTHMKIWAVAVSDKENPFVVSPIYEVFRVKNKNLLNPEFLFFWLCREETIRYAYYNSWGSARENFSFEDMCTVSLPIPDIEIQNAIVEIFETYRIRKRINEDLKQQIKTICPVLIKGSIEEGKKS